jgi:hypothetical protein
VNRYPRGVLTEAGPRLELVKVYGAVKLETERYRAALRQTYRRPMQRSGLGACTRRATARRPPRMASATRRWTSFSPGRHVTSPIRRQVWLSIAKVGVINVAGNRESVSPGIGERFERFMRQLF